MNKDKLKEIDSLMTKIGVKEVIKINDSSKQFIKVDTYKVITNDNQYMYRDKLKKGKYSGNAVVIVPFIDDSNLLMIVQARAFVKKGAVVDFPGGYIEDNEDPLVGAIRELEEETGYTSNDLEEIASYYYDENMGDAIIHLYIAKNVTKCGDRHLDVDEFIEPIIINIADLDELIEKKYICSGSSQLAIAKVKLKRLNI